VSPGERVKLVEELAGQVGATAVVVCDYKRQLFRVGEPSRPVHCPSIRKSLLGALFGRPVIGGTIGLDATLADLGTDDGVPPPLTEAERAARLRDLLTCRLGICHPSNHQVLFDKSAGASSAGRRLMIPIRMEIQGVLRDSSLSEPGR
jgi:CubicO group peptidase (beta-lactamase class C family)